MNKKNYKVGYKKPPKQTQFKPGQSGNPKGRREKEKNIVTELYEEGREIVSLIESGKPKKISKRRAVIKQQMNKAMKGDLASAKFILDLYNKYESKIADKEIEEEPDLSTEEAAAEAVRKMLQRVNEDY